MSDDHAAFPGGRGGGSAQRRSWCQRWMVRGLGGSAFVYVAARMCLRTVLRGAPRAKARSARNRILGHAYEPGRLRAGRARNDARCASIARRRATVKHPHARHTPDNVNTTSRPPRCVKNDTEAWPSHNHTSTPYPNPTRCVLPRVRSTQIAHTGCLVGTLRALYNEGRYGEDIAAESASQNAR